ncbi:MAG: response regulator [Chloroflexi bacterium]|nr:response regulator [Chloroflexota bacterium]
MKILLVDDNEEFCETFSDILSLEGHAVRCVFSGREALAETEAFLPELLFLDVKLPDIDGVHVLKQIASSGRKITVVMMTGYSVPDLIQEALALGARAAFAKPLDYARVFDIVEEASDRKPGA